LPATLPSVEKELEAACTVKSIEILVPDDTNFEQARFLMLQSGNIVLRSKQPQSFVHKFDPFFEDHIDQSTKELLSPETIVG
jgi:hypothetical protein